MENNIIFTSMSWFSQVTFLSIEGFVAMAMQLCNLRREDNFQKQNLTENRCILTVRMVCSYSTSSCENTQRYAIKKKSKDIRIEKILMQVKQHLNHCAAYRSSPFFEFFEDSFALF
jgi:hypothetical protein